MPESFGELLRTHRLAAGLTQAGLAEEAGLSEQAVSMLERGTRSRPRQETVRALVAALKLDDGATQELLLTVRSKRRSSPGASERQTTKSSATAWQLPPTVADFTARKSELATLLSALERAGSESILAVITGMGGVGKTALAVHAGHLAAEHFPDGQLYVKLRGYDPGAALTSAEALGQLLRSLDVRHESIPTGVDEMASLYRSRLAGRRMLILLDDANSIDQVTPLLPGDPACATIITSRRFLASLPGSLIVRLSAMAEADSLRLLSNVAGEDRVIAEEPAAREVSTLTGGLPLALRLVGARLAARPNWLLRHVADQLQDEHRRLDELGLDHSGVRASFAGSLDELLESPSPIDRAAAQTFDLLSLADGADPSVALIARLLDTEPRDAELFLERLVDLHLLDSVGPRRYRMHDLLRTYAGERLSAEARSTERIAAIERGLRFYVAAAWRAQRITHPWSPRRPTEELDYTGVPDFPDMSSALGWIDAEYDALIDLYRKAAEVPGLARRFGPHLALGLFGYLESRAHWARMRTIYELGLASGIAEDDLVTFGWLTHDRAIPDVEEGHLEAGRVRILRAIGLFERAQDPGAMARCCSGMSHICERLDLLDEAIAWGERGLLLATNASDQAVMGTSYLALGILYNRIGRPDDATAAFQTSVELAEALGQPRAVARRHRVAAGSYVGLGQYDRGITHLNAALNTFEGEQDPGGLAEALQYLGSAHLALGHIAEAEKSIREGLRLAEKYGDTHRRARLFVVLASVKDASGAPIEATRLRQRAITIFESAGIPDAAEPIRKLLP